MRELTPIEKDALLNRLRERSKDITKERLIPFVNNYTVSDARGVELDRRDKEQILETAWLEGMIEGIKIFQAFRKEAKCSGDVHTRHCTYSQCKYGEEDGCTVYLGYSEPERNAGQKPSKEEFRKRRDAANENSPSFD